VATVHRLPAFFLLLMAPALAAASPAAGDCNTLMREIKLDVFDRNWPEVQAGTRKLLTGFPDCPHRRQAAYLRAQAMDRGDQQDRAMAAYSGFLQDYCQEPDSGLHCELAQVALYDLAGRLVRENGRRDALAILLEGIEQPGDAGVFAALTLADQQDQNLKADALPYLEKALGRDLDRDIRNRVCLAILKIQPGPSPCADPRPGRATGGPTLISVEVIDKTASATKLRLNMPVALAEAMIRALPAEIRGEMNSAGIDIQTVFQAIRNNAMGTIFELETNEMTVRVWLQ